MTRVGLKPTTSDPDKRFSSASKGKFVRNGFISALYQLSYVALWPSGLEPETSRLAFDNRHSFGPKGQVMDDDVLALYQLSYSHRCRSGKWATSGAFPFEGNRSSSTLPAYILRFSGSANVSRPTSGHVSEQKRGQQGGLFRR